MRVLLVASIFSLLSLVNPTQAQASQCSSLAQQCQTIGVYWGRTQWANMSCQYYPTTPSQPPLLICTVNCYQRNTDGNSSLSWSQQCSPW